MRGLVGGMDSLQFAEEDGFVLVGQPLQNLNNLCEIASVSDDASSSDSSDVGRVFGVIEDSDEDEVIHKKQPPVLRRKPPCQGKRTRLDRTKRNNNPNTAARNPTRKINAKRRAKDRRSLNNEKRVDIDQLENMPWCDEHNVDWNSLDWGKSHQQMLAMRWPQDCKWFLPMSHASNCPVQQFHYNLASRV